MAMTMDTELYKMKEDYDRKVKEIEKQVKVLSAQGSQQQYTAENTEEDESKIALILRAGTLTLQIKG